MLPPLPPIYVCVYIYIHVHITFTIIHHIHYTSNALSWNASDPRWPGVPFSAAALSQRADREWDSKMARFFNTCYLGFLF